MTRSISDDAALVQAAQARPQEFAALYERYYPTVFSYLYRRTGDYSQAEDIAAQTFLQALQALPRYEDRGIPFAAYLLRISSNVMIERARRASRTTLLSESPLLDQDWDRSTEASPEEWTERQEQMAWVQNQMAVLSADQRKAVWLRFWEDRALDDIATQIGRSVGATKQLLHRAIKTLRLSMASQELQSVG